MSASTSSSSSLPSFAISIDDVQAAQKRIAGIATVTPVITCETMNQFANNAAAANASSSTSSSPPSLSLFFKCELFQKIGAFKFRGALNAVRVAMSQQQDSDAAKKLVFVTHSSGNHAQALSLAAKLEGVKAVIVMPKNAPQVKVDGVRGYGGEVVFCEANQAAREQEANAQVNKYAPYSVLVPPYDHKDVMAGQGTLALELLEQAKDLDAIIVPVGGGGMLAGVCIAAKAVNPNIRIYAAEPALADDAFQSLTSGSLIPLPAPTTTVADGLRTSLGSLTYPILQSYVSGVIRVSEEEIISNMKKVYERMKLVIEPSAAVGVAAVMSKQFHTYGPTNANGPNCRDNNPHVIGFTNEIRNAPLKRIGIVLCGGNVDLDALPWLKK